MMKLANDLILIGTLVGAAILVGCASNKPTAEPTETNAGGQTSVAPSGKAAGKQHKALVRFLNADPAAGRYDLWFGNSKSYTNVKYQRLTPYDELPATNGEFRLHPSGWNDTQPLAVRSRSLASGRRYTVVALRDAQGKITLDVIEDDFALPVYNKAKLRVINAAPSAGDIEVVSNGANKPLFKAVHVDAATEYKDVDAMATVIEVRSEGQRQAVPVRQQVMLDAGKMYTLVIVSGTGKNSLTAIPIEDELTKAVTLGI
jgi:hypothetical protein